MFQFALRRPLPVALVLAFMASTPGIAAAQKRPDPLNANEAVPAVVFRSSLAAHRRHQDQPVGSWHQANETVNRIGGWRIYAREASQPEPLSPATAPAAPAAPATSNTKPAAPAHTGPQGGQHGGHQGHQERAKP